MLHLSLPQASDVTVKLYTIVFRMVQEKTFPSVPAGTGNLTLELKDKWGSRLANGLYYVRVQAGPQKTILKLIVAR